MSAPQLAPPDDSAFGAWWSGLTPEEREAHPEGYDRYRKITSYIDAGIKRAERAQRNGADLIDRTAAAVFPGARYPHVWIDDAEIAADSAYHVKGIVERGRFIVIYGPSGGGKSTWAIDITGHIVAGLSWRGRRVRSGLVVYVASEAGASILQRVIAWRDQNLADSREGRIPLAIITRSPDLRNRVEVEKLIEALRAIAGEIGVPLALIVFDTLSRSAPGADENSPEDMGEIIGACDRMRETLGAAVALIHHSGKDSGRGARGHSALTKLSSLDEMLESLARCELLLSAPLMAIHDEMGKIIGTRREVPSDKTDALQKQIDELKSRPTMVYQGTWDAKVKYVPGMFVTHAGSCWHAQVESRGVRPGDGNCWRLAVKAGRDGAR